MSPTSVKKIRSFLGLAGYYRRFIENFSKIAKPMTALLKKDTKFHWTEKCEASFQELKKMFDYSPSTDSAGYTQGFPSVLRRLSLRTWRSDMSILHHAFISIFIALWVVISHYVQYLCIFSLILQGLLRKGANIRDLFCTTPKVMKLHGSYFWI